MGQTFFLFALWKVIEVKMPISTDFAREYHYLTGYLLVPNSVSRKLKKKKQPKHVYGIFPKEVRISGHPPLPVPNFNRVFLWRPLGRLLFWYLFVLHLFFLTNLVINQI